MTVCIGAVMPKHGAIVAVSDMMLSDDVSSADVAAVKMSPLFGGDRWWCLYAGLPTEFEELRQSTRNTKTPRTLKDAIRAVERAYDGLRKHRIEREILAPSGLTYGQFLKSGAVMFGDAYFRELSERCLSVRPETDLLVMGFDAANHPHIIEARRDGTCVVHDQLGFYAIGAGAWAALGSMYSHYRDIRLGVLLNRSIYRLCEAKFVSEIARSVGSVITVANIFHADGTQFDLFINESDPIRVAWMAQRKLPIPQEALDEIDSAEREGRLSFDRQRRVNPEPSKPS